MKKLDDSFYAYPALKKFPIDTKEGAINSYGAYQMQKHAFTEEQREEIECNFKKAAAFYGLVEAQDAEPMQKQASLVFKGETSDVALSRIDTPQELADAVQYIMEKRASEKREDLAEAAKYLLWSANNMNVDVNCDRMRKIARIAGIGVGDKDAIVRELNRRAMEYPLSEDNRAELYKYAKEVEDLSVDEVINPESLNTLCKVMDNVDFMCMDKYAREKMDVRPEDVVFAKNAADIASECDDLLPAEKCDIVLSKEAILEKTAAVNDFLIRHNYHYTPKYGKELLEKVASLDEFTLEALAEELGDE